MTLERGWLGSPAGQAAALFAASGLLALVAMVDPQAHRGPLVAIALVDMVLAVGVHVLPWASWPRPTSSLIAIPALAVVGMAAWVELLPPRSYGVFFVLIFAWLGLHQRRKVALAFLVPAAVAYAWPLLAVEDSDPPFDPRALVLVLAISGLTCVVVSRAVGDAVQSRMRAEHAVEVFRILSLTTSTLRHAESATVLASVVDGIMALGYDGANLSVIDERTDFFHIEHPRGVARAFADGEYPASSGLTGQVRDGGTSVVILDYQAEAQSIDTIRSTGIRTCVAAPVFADGRLAGVLNASCVTVAPPDPVDVEAIQLLARAAGTALETASELAGQRATAKHNAEASLTDELTGLGNRRFGRRLLSELLPGDSIAMLDLDHFKSVNDRYGHSAGDELLVRFARHVEKELRSKDSAFRFGGEEFAVRLPGTNVENAVRVIERIRETWMELGPAASFSGGVAEHRAGRTSNQTLVDADAALYRAKGGRPEPDDARRFGRSPLRRGGTA